MAILFMDSFDHYDTLTLKWSTNLTGIINLTGAAARTGIGGCLCFPFGPELNVIPQAGAVVGDAYRSSTVGNNDINGFISGTGVFRVRQVRTRSNSDGSISIWSRNDPFPVVLGTSAPNLIQANTYAYIETKISAFSASATVTVRVNGLVVLTCLNVNTDPDGTGTYGTFYLEGPGGGQNAAHDDVYLLNLIDSAVPGNPNNDFLGAVRIYSQPPTADASPLDWAPNSGTTHYTQVREIPPDDGTTYVQASSIGDEDQYVYGTTGITPPVQVFGVQVNLDAALDIGGSGAVAPSVGGVEGNSTALSTSYTLSREPYDGNPVSGGAWQLTDFATVRFGPKRTN